MDAPAVCQALVAWASAQPAIQGVALVGSYARRAARADSDMDLMILTTTPQAYRQSTAWMEAVAWPLTLGQPQRIQDEDHGAVWSRRVWFAPAGDELDLSFGLPSWADTAPMDDGTYQVVSGGCRILYDPVGLLEKLLIAAREKQVRA